MGPSGLYETDRWWTDGGLTSSYDQYRKLSNMRTRDLILLLVTGWVSECCLQTDVVTRSFHPVYQKRSWSEAQSHCRDQFTDLSSIQDAINQEDIQKATADGKFWIGLYNSTWKWSMDHHSLQEDNWFSNWSTKEPGPGKCVTTSLEGSWSVGDCEDLRIFSCYDAAAKRHFLVEQTLSWSEAQTHCRSESTDLSSIRSPEENVLISNLLQDIGPSAWIGLRRHFWLWSDQSGAPYRNWAKDQPDQEKACVIMQVSSSSADWFTKPCKEKYNFLCQTLSPEAASSVRRLVKLRLRTGSVDVNDPKLQHSILQQLKKKLQEQGVTEEVKLSWRRQPDGNIFHRQERAPPPGDCEEFCG